jgi:hypothetical protein
VNLLLLEEAGKQVTLDGARGRHLLRVLHVEPGQQVRVGVVDGPRGTATVESIAGETVTLADVSGPGVVTHLWITVAANEYGWPRLLRRGRLGRRLLGARPRREHADRERRGDKEFGHWYWKLR